MQYEQAKIEREKEQQELWRLARQRAGRLWDCARPVTTGAGGIDTSADVHPYLAVKRVKPFGLKRLRQPLVVPFRNASGALTTLQFIQPDGAKVLMTDGEISGSYCALGPHPGQVMIACEGWATGATLLEAAGLPVAVAYSAGNLPVVCAVLRAKFPDILLIVAGDNDHATDGNPGMRSAQVCASQSGGRVLIPDFIAGEIISEKWSEEDVREIIPTDWNDYYRLHGLEAVRDAVLACVAGDVVGDLPDGLCRDLPFLDLDAKPGEVEEPKPETAHPKTKAEFEAAVDGSDDFEFLTEYLLLCLARSGLPKPALDAVLAKIAKKSGVTKASLVDELRTKFSNGRGNGPVQDSDDSIIHELNQEHAVLSLGGRVVIMNREFEPVLKRKIYTFSGRRDFQLRYLNRKVWNSREGEETDWAEYWLNHPDRAEYKGLVFSPGDAVDGYLNLWQGWAIQPVAGDCARFLEFVEGVICNGDGELYDYLMNWAAHLFQRPQELPETAIVFRGEQGTGKNTFFDTLGLIVGREHYLMLNSMNQLLGRFTSHLCNVLLVFANEAVWGGKRNEAGQLKSMLSDPVQSMEAKNVDIRPVANFKRVGFASNENWAAPVETGNRRYILFDIPSTYKNNHPFFKQLHAEMKSGGASHLFHYLLQRNRILDHR